MLNFAALYGTLAGVIVTLPFVVVLAFGVKAEMGGMSEYFGFLIMFLASTMIFFGVKQYRDREQGGVITFQTALWLGLMISTFGGIIYVMVWEVYLAATNYSFIQLYADAVLKQAVAEGKSAGELEAMRQAMEAYKQGYANPLYRFAATFLEFYPIEVVAAFISAAVLRNAKAVPA